MASTDEIAREGLTRVIRRVRNRWRLRVVLRGATLLLLAGSLAIALSAFGLDYFRYSPWALAVFRIAAYAGVAALVLRLVALPAAIRISDERIALYIEEHDASLQATLLSAVQVSAPRRNEAGAPSPALAQRLVETAIQKCQEVDYGRLVERRGLQRFSALLAGAAGAAMVAAILSPAFLRRAAPYLLTPWSVRAASPYSIEVTPGHANLARGADQEVAAMLHGFEAGAAELATRRARASAAASTPPPSGGWKRVPMTADPQGKGFRLVLLDLAEATEYFVEAGGVRSPIFRLDVTDRPYVKRIDLEYRFPAHTGLPPRKVEDGGDVTALAGTVVALRIEPTVPVTQGQLVVEGSAVVPLTREPDGTLVGALTMGQSGFYRVDLPASDGVLRKASPDYAIEVLLDQPPTVAVSKPGRDTRVTSIEEVFTEARAEDDYGVSRLELVYSANGGPERVVELVPPGRGRKTASAGHTFFLEEMGLEVGDSISYFARASDNASRAQVATSDIYFMEVRPFGREYRKAEETGMGGAGGEDGGALSQEQRQIIAATFKVLRDRARTADKEFAEDMATLARSEAHLGSQVRALLERMTSRGGLESGSDLQKTAEALRASLPEVEAARGELAKTRAREALPPEQRALRHLLHAESVFREMQVSMGQSGASSDGSKSSAEDLADLFELEMDKLRNQYETLRRSQQQQRDNAVDEAKERLAELARRQQQENERMKRLADQAPGASGGDPRADLARETEELARKLERLSRENGGASLQDSARRLREAADAMKRAAAGGKDQGLAEGLSALERLQEAGRRLGEGRGQGLEQEINEARRRAERLAETQRDIGAEVDRMTGDAVAGADAGRLARLRDRKDVLAGEVADLEAQLDRLARDSRRDRKEASRRLQGAANGVREDKLKEKIRFSKGLGRGLSPEYARQLEADIAQGLDSIGRKVKEAGSALGGSENDKRAAALERTRDLVRNLESMESRLRERAERGAPDGADPGKAGGSGKANGSMRDGPTGSGGGGGAGKGTPRGGALTAEEARQLRRERQERLREAQELGQGLPGGRPDLARVLEGIGAWNSKKTDDPRALARITAEVIENLKMFEYTLRREAEGLSAERLALSEGDDVPDGFRPLVEEYYKSLARKPKK